MAEGGSGPSYWTVRRLVRRGIKVQLQEIGNNNTNTQLQELESRDRSRDRNTDTSFLDIGRRGTVSNESDDSDTEPTTINLVDSDESDDISKSDDRDDLLEFEKIVHVIQSDTDTDSDNDDKLQTVSEQLKE
jgi:hypothetical protein